MANLKTKLEALPRRIESISGQNFSYVKLEDVLSVVDAHHNAEGDQISADPMDFFTANVDKWGSVEWFDRLAKAIRNQDKAVCAKDDFGTDMYRNIAASSAMRLVRDYEQQVRAALASPVATRVKPLEFDGTNASRGFWRASTDFGYYHIKRYETGAFIVRGPMSNDNIYPTFEAAKAAAQADYEKRILSALEPVATREDVVRAAQALVDDVKRRYPEQELHCKYMRALDVALSTLLEGGR